MSALKRQLTAAFAELRGFRGNARACVFVEPMWGLPFNLYATYASVYMLELGCTSLQVGLVSSISLACNMLFSLPSGHITDRLGRKRASLLFDMISWSAATLIWATAGGLAAFIVAAVVNSVVRIVHVSWSCLMIEGTDPEQRVHVYAWVNVAGLVAGFVAPLAGLLVARFGVVRSMRGLYVFAFASMTTMFLLRNALTRESPIGIARMGAVKGWGPREIVSDFVRVGRQTLRSPLVLIAFTLSILLNAQGNLRATFTPILLTRGLGLPAANIAIFPALSSVGMLVVYLFLLPALSRGDPARPLAAGLGAIVAGSILLAVSPRESYLAVVGGTALQAVGMAIATPFTDALIANSVRDEDRATSLGIVYTLVFGFSAPSGYLGGLLATVSDRLPLALVALLGAVSVVLALRIPRARRAGAGGGAGTV